VFKFLCSLCVGRLCAKLKGFNLTPIMQPPVSFTVTGETRETPLEALREIWRFRALIVELVQRDLKVRYKKRVGGILWSLFAPLMQVLTITLMVKLFLQPINNFSAYLMPVMFLWQFFQNTVLDAAQSMVMNAQLARKIYFPRAILPMVTLISNLLHFTISFAFTLFYFLIIPPGDPIYPKLLQLKFLLVFPLILCVGFLALGVGYLLSYLSTLYDDVRYLSTTLLALFFYAVPILYPVEKVYVNQKIYPLYMLNPMASLMVGFQRAMLPPLAVEGTTPVAFPVFWVGLGMLSSLVILLLGFLIFERSKWTMMERL